MLAFVVAVNHLLLLALVGAVWHILIVEAPVVNVFQPLRRRTWTRLRRVTGTKGSPLLCLCVHKR